MVFTGRNGGLGKTIRISHGFGFTTVYGHLNEITVELGDEVHRGDQIGSVGNTGRSTGAHLHYEVHADGKVGGSAVLHSRSILGITRPNKDRPHAFRAGGVIGRSIESVPSDAAPSRR